MNASGLPCTCAYDLSICSPFSALQVYGLPTDITEAEAEAKRDDESHKDDELKIPLVHGSSHGSSSRRAGNILNKKCGLLTLRQWWGVIFFTSFCIFHALNPLREKVLYPDNPSWTEEGHFGAAHRGAYQKYGKFDVDDD